MSTVASLDRLASEPEVLREEAGRVRAALGETLVRGSDVLLRAHTALQTASEALEAAS